MANRWAAGAAAGVAMLALAPGLGHAQTLSCPAPGTLVQVEPCPTEEQLRISYVGFCSDNRRIYDADREACSSFENYLQRKNVTLWESADGQFAGYLSCQAGTAAPASWPAPRLSIVLSGKVTQVRCSYGPVASMSHRTRARCVVADAAACTADPAACRARCE